MNKEFISELLKKIKKAKNHFAEFSKMVGIVIGVKKSIENVAYKMYAYNYSSETLMIAEEKVNYLKNINMKQAEIKF